MIIVFFGDNEFITKRKLKTTINNYKNKHKSGLNLFSLSSDSFSFDDFKAALETSSMFDEKKCIVLKNIFSDKNEEKIKDYIKKKSIKDDKDVFLIFSEDKNINKNNSFFRWITEKPSIIYESKKFSDIELRRWIEKEFAVYGSSVDSSIVASLATFSGGDLWRLHNDIKKLALYKKNIRINDLNELVLRDENSDIFRALDFLVNKKKKEAVKIFYKQMAEGKNISYIISMISFQFRNLLKIKELSDSGLALSDIKNITNLHPFVIKKTMSSVAKYSSEDLKGIYKKILNADIRLKSSRVDKNVILDNLILSI